MGEERRQAKRWQDDINACLQPTRTTTITQAITHEQTAYVNQSPHNKTKAAPTTTTCHPPPDNRQLTLRNNKATTANQQIKKRQPNFGDTLILSDPQVHFILSGTKRVPRMSVPARSEFSCRQTRNGTKAHALCPSAHVRTLCTES